MHSFKNKKSGLPASGLRYLLILLALMSFLAPTAYAEIPGPVEAVPAGTPETVPPVPPAPPAVTPPVTPAVDVSGTTAVTPAVDVSGTTAAVLPVTGQSILWVVIIGAVLLCGGIFLFLKTRKTQGS